MVWCNKYKQHKASKEDRRRITPSSMASNESVGLVYVKRWKEKNWYYVSIV